MTGLSEPVALDPAGPNTVMGDLPGFELLRPFNHEGILAAADVHAAIRLCRLAGEGDDQLALAVALAVRAPRVGHVSVDLRDIRASAVEAGEEVDLELLPWPDPEPWIARVATSGLVDAQDGTEVDGGSGRPLKLLGGDLYLERYWRDEVTVAAEISARLTSTAEADEAPAGAAAPGRSAPLDPPQADGDEDRLRRLFPGPASSDQRDAARLVLAHRFAVIAGGPGTGKTTTIARLLVALFEDASARGLRPPLVGLAAPTGKAAARMEDAVRAEAGRIETSAEVRTALRDVHGSTLHRLLGTRFDRPGRFRHHRSHRLPHDIVVVDEASMVSLSLMASLAQAVRPDARLVLVGDPEQLVSVEAGAVLADIVGRAGRTRPVGVPDGVSDEPPAGTDPPISRSICVLRQNHRFSGSLARLSSAVRAGDDAAVVDILAGDDPVLSWIDADPGELLLGGEDSATGPLQEVRASTVAWVEAVHRLAAAGEAEAAIAELRRHRVLCAHRRGAAGVRAWNRVIEGWVADASGPSPEDDSWYPGRPVMVAVNDYALRLFNGDAGVTVAGPAGTVGETSGRLTVAFDEGADRPARLVSPTRLTAVDTVYAMTVHKSQGSEFDRVTLLLPPAASRLLTRELLYTAITRARTAVTVVGAAEALRTAVRTPIARASGLGPRLWGDAAV